MRLAIRTYIYTYISIHVLVYLLNDRHQDVDVHMYIYAGCVPWRRLYFVRLMVMFLVLSLMVWILVLSLMVLIFF